MNVLVGARVGVGVRLCVRSDAADQAVAANTIHHHHSTCATNTNRATAEHAHSQTGGTCTTMRMINTATQQCASSAAAASCVGNGTPPPPMLTLAGVSYCLTTVLRLTAGGAVHPALGGRPRCAGAHDSHPVRQRHHQARAADEGGTGRGRAATVLCAVGFLGAGVHVAQGGRGQEGRESSIKNMAQSGAKCPSLTTHPEHLHTTSPSKSVPPHPSNTPTPAACVAAVCGCLNQTHLAMLAQHTSTSATVS